MKLKLLRSAFYFKKASHSTWLITRALSEWPCSVLRSNCTERSMNVFMTLCLYLTSNRLFV